MSVSKEGNKSTTVYPQPEPKAEDKKVEPKVSVFMKKEEPKKLTVVELLMKALDGHGHIYSQEEKEVLGKDNPDLKKEEDDKKELRRIGLTEKQVKKIEERMESDKKAEADTRKSEDKK